MTREQILQYAREKYGTESEHLWVKYPNYEILRKPVSGKWYGILMDVPKNKVGLQGDEIIDILLLKDKPENVVHICEMEGFAPAYHMNKKHWFGVILDNADEAVVYGMIDKSYQLTK